VSEQVTAHWRRYPSADCDILVGRVPNDDDYQRAQMGGYIIEPVYSRAITSTPQPPAVAECDAELNRQIDSLLTNAENMTRASTLAEVRWIVEEVRRQNYPGCNCAVDDVCDRILARIKGKVK
jgi:hypothetical protein